VSPTLELGLLFSVDALISYRSCIRIRTKGGMLPSRLHARSYRHPLFCGVIARLPWLQFLSLLTHEICLIQRILLPVLPRIFVRGLLLIVATSFSLVVLELGVTAWYRDLGEWGPYEIVKEWNSPFIFKGRADVLESRYVVEPRDGSIVAQAWEPLGRDPERPYRILSYGDSIAGGYGIDRDEMYASLLQERLNDETGRSPEIFTMYRGHSPTLYSFHMRKDVPLLRPDAVIMQIELANDISDEAMAYTRGRDSTGLPLELLRYRYTLGWDGHILAPLSFSGSFIERTKVYAKLSRFMGRALQKYFPNPVFREDAATYFYSHSSERWFLNENVLATGFDRLFEVLGATHQYFEQREIKFLLLILPSRYLYTGDRYTSSSITWLKRAEDRASALGIPFFSPWEEIADAGGASLFMDFCHPTPEGNRAIAEALEPVLLERWLAPQNTQRLPDSRVEPTPVASLAPAPLTRVDLVSPTG
jgi:lysophospholipase L1-like esterase